MPTTPISLPAIPPELWLYIHRLAIGDLVPLATPYASLPDDLPLRRFLKAACSIGRVCRLWNELAKELLYQHVWIKDTQSWPSLSGALQRPDVARRVRRLRLSTTRFDHNRAALHYYQRLEVLVQPEFPRAEPVYFAAAGKLAPLLHLKCIYWVASAWSSALLERVLRAAPNLEHVSLSTAVIDLPRGPAPLAVPILPRLKTLTVAELSQQNVRAFLSTDLTHLTHLTIARAHLTSAGFPVLPSLTALTLIGDCPRMYGFPVPFPAMLVRCPALRELWYDAHAFPVHPVGRQTAPHLRCVWLHLPDGMQGSRLGYEHLRMLRGPAFVALERVVLDGGGWAHLRQSQVASQVRKLRMLGCRVEGSDGSEWKLD